MAFEENDDKTIYLVLMNCGEQYSLMAQAHRRSQWKVGGVQEGHENRLHGAYASAKCGRICGAQRIAFMEDLRRRRASSSRRLVPGILQRQARKSKRSIAAGLRGPQSPEATEKRPS